MHQGNPEFSPYLYLVSAQICKIPMLHCVMMPAPMAASTPTQHNCPGPVISLGTAKSPGHCFAHPVLPLETSAFACSGLKALICFFPARKRAERPVCCMVQTCVCGLCNPAKTTLSPASSLSPISPAFTKSCVPLCRRLRRSQRQRQCWG